MPFQFEWDEAKRESNLAKHGVDFLAVAPLFAGAVVEFADERRDYSEQRIRCLGTVAGRIYHVVYTWRGPNRRIISVRPANGREQRAYHARHP